MIAEVGAPAIAGGAAVLVTALVGAYVAVRRTPAESSQILVSAAKDVVVIQQGALEELREGLAGAQRQIDELKAVESEVSRLREEVGRLRGQNGLLMGENRRLRERVAVLEGHTTP